MAGSTEAYRILDIAVSGRLGLTWLRKGCARRSIDADGTEILNLVSAWFFTPILAASDGEYPSTRRHVPTEEGYERWWALAVEPASARQVRS